MDDNEADFSEDNHDFPEVVFDLVSSKEKSKLLSHLNFIDSISFFNEKDQSK